MTIRELIEILSKVPQDESAYLYFDADWDRNVCVHPNKKEEEFIFLDE